MNDVMRISTFARVDPALASLVVGVATRGGHSLKALRGESHMPDLVAARRTIVSEAFAEGYSLSEIGRALNRDHSTIAYHVKHTGARRRRPEVQLSFLIGPLFDCQPANCERHAA
jgi:DNA-binding CsgD family transcriptional regulator